MKRVLRTLIRLYPAWWRQRYGKELEALLEDSGSRSRDAWDLLRGAMAMQMRTWSFGRIVIVCGLAGLLLTGVVAFSIPYKYHSTAILQSEGDRGSEDWRTLAQAAFTPQALSGIATHARLFPGVPAEDTVDRMRRGIRIEEVDGSAVRVSFAYEDPGQAQQVNRELVGRLIAANLDTSGNPNKLVLKVAAPPDQPRRKSGRKRYGLAGLGLPAGLGFGVVLALILRQRTPAH